MLGLTFDGASVNRRFVKIHDTSEKLVYKVQNPFADGREVFFFLTHFSILLIPPGIAGHPLAGPYG